MVSGLIKLRCMGSIRWWLLVLAKRQLVFFVKSSVFNDGASIALICLSKLGVPCIITEPHKVLTISLSKLGLVELLDVSILIVFIGLSSDNDVIICGWCESLIAWDVVGLLHHNLRNIIWVITVGLDYSGCSRLFIATNLGLSVLFGHIVITHCIMGNLELLVHL